MVEDVPGCTRPSLITPPTVPVPDNRPDVLVIETGPDIDPVTCNSPEFTAVVVVRILFPLKISVPKPVEEVSDKVPVPLMFPEYVPLVL